MAKEPLYLPVKSVVLFIACGTLVFVLVFIFAKRQITRFALKSTRGPHHPIGADAPKSMKQEIERRLHRTTEIKYEPQLLSRATEQTSNGTFNGETCHFLYRMKAVDALKLLDMELQQCSPSIRRKPGYDLLTFLLELRQNGPLGGIKVDLVRKVAEAYEHAKHNPAEFQQQHYQEFMDLLNHVIEHIRNMKNRGSALQQEERKVGPFPCGKGKGGGPVPTTAILTGTVLSSQPAKDLTNSEVTYRPRKSNTGQEEDRATRLTPRSSVSSQTSNCDLDSQQHKEERLV